MIIPFSLLIAQPGQVPVHVGANNTSQMVQQRVNQEQIQRLERQMASEVAQQKMVGCVGLVMRNGRLLWSAGIGYANLESRSPMRPDAIFQVMSMTKPVAAVAAMILVERGQLRLHDPVADYLPEFSSIKVKGEGGLKDPASAPRVRQLFQHTSGIASDTPISDEDRASLTLAQFVKLVSEQPLFADPGTAERYSGPAVSTLGRIVEVVSGQRFEDFCQKEIFDPLGMKDTHYFLPASKSGRLAMVYRIEDGKIEKDSGDPLRKGARFANPAGGLYSTASDMAAFHQMMANGGILADKRVLAPLTVRAMTTISSPTILPGASQDLGYGLMWSIVRGPAPSRSLQTPGSFGHAGAFGTYGWVDPSQGLVAIFMSQRAWGADREIDLFRAMVNASLRQ